MRLVAASLVGISCALLVAHLTGLLPRHRRRRRRPEPRRGRVGVWLQQAGLALTPLQFVAGSAVLGLLALVPITAITGSAFVAAVPAAAVAWLPRAYYGRRRLERLRRVQEAWPDGLRDLLASISAGRSLGQAVVDLSRTGPEPLREAFGRYPLLARMLGTVPALEIVKEELADPTSDRVLEVLVLAHEQGGPLLGEILSDLVAATTRDIRLRDEIDSEGLEMRLNARAVVVLPWLVLVALTASDGPFRDFYRSGRGVAVLLVGGLMSAVGSLVVARLAREPAEPRVFDTSRRQAAT